MDTNEITIPKKFTVYRDSWLRGEGHDASRLLRKEDSKMCCVGQFAIACGNTKRTIYDKSSIFQIAGWKDVFQNAIQENRIIDAYDANDSRTLSDRERESRITSSFAELGIEIEFVDGKMPEEMLR